MALLAASGRERRPFPVRHGMKVEHADRRQKAVQCGMATVTYFDREGAAPRVTWHDVPFRDGEPSSSLPQGTPSYSRREGPSAFRCR